MKKTTSISMLAIMVLASVSVIFGVSYATHYDHDTAKIAIEPVMDSYPTDQELTLTFTPSSVRLNNDTVTFNLKQSQTESLGSVQSDHAENGTFTAKFKPSEHLEFLQKYDGHEDLFIEVEYSGGPYRKMITMHTPPSVEMQQVEALNRIADKIDQVILDNNRIIEIYNQGWGAGYEAGKDWCKASSEC